MEGLFNCAFMITHKNKPNFRLFATRTTPYKGTSFNQYLLVQSPSHSAQSNRNHLNAKKNKRKNWREKDTYGICRSLSLVKGGAGIISFPSNSKASVLAPSQQVLETAQQGFTALKIHSSVSLRANSQLGHQAT